MMRGFCPRGFCPERAYVLMELCMEGVLSGGGFVLPSSKTHDQIHYNNISNPGGGSYLKEYPIQICSI